MEGGGGGGETGREREEGKGREGREGKMGLCGLSPDWPKVSKRDQARPSRQTVWSVRCCFGVVWFVCGWPR